MPAIVLFANPQLQRNLTTKEELAGHAKQSLSGHREQNLFGASGNSQTPSIQEVVHKAILHEDATLGHVHHMYSASACR